MKNMRKKLIFIFCTCLMLLTFTFNKGIFVGITANAVYETSYGKSGQPQTLKRLVNRPDGYALLFPVSLTLDTTHAAYVTAASDSDFSVTISAERSPYEDVDEYIAYYQNRLYTNEGYLTDNGFTKDEDFTVNTAGRKTRIITLSQNEPSPNSPYATYTFAYQMTGGRYFNRYLFKGRTFSEEYREKYMAILNSYSPLVKAGKNISSFSPKFIMPEHLDAATAALLSKLQVQKEVDWGIFVRDMFAEGITKTIPELEEKLGRPFDVALMYHCLGTPLLTEGMEEAKRQGKLIEYTLQVSSFNNENIFGYTPMFDVAAGKKDDEIRALAKELKAFGDPLLFRLNNEMNSDWTSYSGIVTLSDPDIYISVWRRIYDIFKEEGVTNTIWIFNPNDRGYPPVKWNNYSRYYPGDEYVQMLGVTGYNTGDYYWDLTRETWRDFKVIYDNIEAAYKPYFSDFPWIITEFSTSSHGGDKVKWISDMFRYLPNYKNIKIAVWFSFADFDIREGRTEIPSRPYWLDETPETLEAFKKGFAKK